MSQTHIAFCKHERRIRCDVEIISKDNINTMSEQTNVSLSTLPLKAYDFFSILFPGLSVLLAAYFFEDLYSQSQMLRNPGDGTALLPVHWLIYEIWHIPPNASVQAAVFIISTCIIYLAGQIVSAIANFFLDRIFVYKCYGYPYEHLLLDDYKERVFVDYFSRRFYRGSIFWLHFAALFFVLHEIYPAHSILFFVASTCFLIFLIAFAARLLCQFLYRRKFKVENGFKYFICVYAFCYKWIVNFIQHINQTKKPLQKELSEKYKMHFKNDFGIDSDTAENDNFWLTLFYVRQKDSRLSELVLRWQQTATFTRNMAASFYMVFGYAGTVLWYECDHKGRTIVAPDNFHIAVALCGLFALAVFLVIRFYYFYVSYYSKCLFRAYVFLHFEKCVSPLH